MVLDRKLYDVMGVEPDAPEADIKRAYKRLALKYHPDKNKDDPEAESKFKEATEAYTILADAERRRLYDEHGVTSGQDGQPPPPPDLSELLNNIFGGGGGGGPFGFSMGGGGGFNPFGSRQHQQQHTVSQATVPISLSDVFHGGNKVINIELLDACAKCGGKGCPDPASDMLSCLACQGRGRIVSQIGPFVTQVTCGSCGGKGRMIKPGRACAACGGAKIAKTKKTFEVRIPRGIPNGHRHSLPGKGEFSVDLQKHHDLELTFVHELPPNVVVDAASEAIRVDLQVDLDDLLAGFSKVLQLWAPLKIASKGYVDPRKIFAFANKGLPRFRSGDKGAPPKFGSLEVRLDVIFPAKEAFARFSPVFQKVFGKPPPTAAENEDAELVLV